MSSSEAPRVFVTGASGFLGKHLVQRLVNRGFRVRCLLRQGSSSSGLEGEGVEIVRLSESDTEGLKGSVRGCDRVVHSAAMVSDWGTVAEIRDSNVRLTQTLVEGAKQQGIKRFIHVSTTDVYGHPGEPAVSESWTPKETFSNWYSQTKREAEQVVISSGLSYCILRPATIYGPGSTAMLGEMASALRFGRMLTINGGESIAGLTYVENVVDCLQLVMNHPLAENQIYNVSDEESLSWKEFLLRLADGMGCRARFIDLPRSVCWGLGLGLEEIYRACRKWTGVRVRPLLSRQAVQILSVNQDFSSQKIQTELGYKRAHRLDGGMSKSIEWLSTYGSCSL